MPAKKGKLCLLWDWLQVLIDQQNLSSVDKAKQLLRDTATKRYSEGRNKDVS